MSWIRWGSPCQSMLFDPEDDACSLETCPGSDLYVYDSTSGFIECCACPLIPNNGEGYPFQAKTPLEMVEHLKKHQEAGHHFRPSLLRRPLGDLGGRIVTAIEDGTWEARNKALDAYHERQMAAFYSSVGANREDPNSLWDAILKKQGLR